MTIFFRYSSLEEFSFAFVGHVQDYADGYGSAVVTLLDGRKCTVHHSDKDAFYEAFDLFKKQSQLTPVPHGPTAKDKPA